MSNVDEYREGTCVNRSEHEYGSEVTYDTHSYQIIVTIIVTDDNSCEHKNKREFTTVNEQRLLYTSAEDKRQT